MVVKKFGAAEALDLIIRPILLSHCPGIWSAATEKMLACYLADAATSLVALVI